MTDHYYAELIDTHVEIDNKEAYNVRATCSHLLLPVSLNAARHA
jgi:hypothetical protein